jgi:EAL domain-containing protein (putative c-di-GMP-specific phosphodiesterase class I)
LTSVAEGVEEEAALRSLKEMGCDAAQGFQICRPLAAVRVADFVREYEPRQRRGTAAA